MKMKVDVNTSMHIASNSKLFFFLGYLLTFSSYFPICERELGRRSNEKFRDVKCGKSNQIWNQNNILSLYIVSGFLYLMCGRVFFFSIPQEHQITPHHRLCSFLSLSQSFRFPLLSMVGVQNVKKMHKQKQNLGNWITSVHLAVIFPRVRFPINEICENDFDWIIFISLLCVSLSLLNDDDDQCYRCYTIKRAPLISILHRCSS